MPAAALEKHAQQCLRGQSQTSSADFLPGAVVLVGATGHLGSYLARALETRRRIRAVVDIREAATELLGAGGAEIAWHDARRADGGLDWNKTLSAEVSRVRRRGGCAGFKRHGAESDAACPLGEVTMLVIVVGDDDKLGASVTDRALKAAATRTPPLRHLVLVGRSGSSELGAAEEATTAALASCVTVVRCATLFESIEEVLSVGAPGRPPPVACRFGRPASSSLGAVARRALDGLWCAGTRDGVCPLDEDAVASYVAEEVLGDDSADPPKARLTAVNLRGPDATSWTALAREAAATSVGAGVLARASRLPRFFARAASIAAGAAARCLGSARSRALVETARDRLPSRARRAEVERGRAWTERLREISEVWPAARSDPDAAYRELAEAVGFEPRALLVGRLGIDGAARVIDRVYYEVIAPSKHSESDTLGARLSAHVHKARTQLERTAPDSAAAAALLVHLLFALHNEARISLRSTKSGAELTRDMLAEVEREVLASAGNKE